MFLLIHVVGLGDVVAVIPMAALVAVMVMVSVDTFDWHSIQPATLRRMPKSETFVMVPTVEPDRDPFPVQRRGGHPQPRDRRRSPRRPDAVRPIVGLNQASSDRHERLSGRLATH